MDKIDFRKPVDHTRDDVVNAAPPEKSIYSNPVTMMNEVRNPTSKQVGAKPDMTYPRKNI
jgi:hypothetical protein